MRLPSNLVLDDDAREWFTGEEEGVSAADKTQYDCTRCELNAFSSDELATTKTPSRRWRGRMRLPPSTDQYRRSNVGTEFGCLATSTTKSGGIR